MLQRYTHLKNNRHILAAILSSLFLFFKTAIFVFYN
jgi:hypothetical protein